ncbi:MAG: methyltransferase [Pseudomonadota bacterium]
MTWRERLLRVRDRWLADPRVQRWAVALPFMRPIANRNAQALFNLCTGFVHTQVVTACVELGLLDVLADGRLTSEAIAARIGLERDAALRLLKAAAALKLIERSGADGYRLSELGAAMRGAAGIKELVRHNQVYYRDLADPVALLKGRAQGLALPQYWPYAQGDDGVAALEPGATTPYSALMAATQPLIAEDVIAAFDFSKHTRLLDIGGGDGTFARTVATATPGLHVGVADLPAVADLAAAAFEREGLAQRSATHGIDFHRDTLPDGYDLMTLVRILLDHDDETVRALLRNVRAALPPGGKLLIIETMSGARGAERLSDAYFGFYLLAMGRGRTRSLTEIKALLHEAGFSNARTITTRRSLITQVIAAQA